MRQGSMPAEAEGKASIYQLFQFADGFDKVLVVLGIMGSIGEGLIQPLLFFVLSRMINIFGPTDAAFPAKTVDRHTLHLVFVALGGGAAAFVEGWCWTRTGERQTSVMRRKYLEAVLRQEVSYFETNSSISATYEVVSSISTDADTIQDVLSDKIPNIFANITAFSFLIVAAFILSWRMTLAALPFALLFIVPGVTFGKLLMQVSIEMRKEYALAGGIAEQAISSIRTVVSYVGEHGSLEKFKEALEKSSVLGVKQGLVKGLMVGSMGMVYVVWAYETWIGSILVTKKGASGGSVIVAALCILYAGFAIMAALPNVRYVSEALIAYSRLSKLINMLPQLETIGKTGATIENPRGEIKFKNVKFAYPSRPETVVLSSLNLQVEAGQTIGLVGGSGSGKSTVISLLQRFYKPDEGNIFLDGHDIGELQLNWYRSQIGLVSQEPILFATSIKENILFGNEKATMNQVIDAAKAANAHDFINKLPNGYDTHVGHFGFQMSGGQKQRIAIARALIRDPKILLLDEATSALDAYSEKLVQDALEKASSGRTTIVIAHRLSTLRGADLIAVLQEGKLVECGSHEQLTQMNGEEGGIYAKMIQLQNSKVKTGSPLTDTQSNPENPVILGTYNIPELQSKKDYHTTPKKVTSKKPSIPSPSQWRLLKMNRPEWKRGVLGCTGAVTFAAVNPLYAYCLGSILSVYFSQDKELIKSKTRFYAFIFLTLAVATVFSNILQHYSFGVMGECLTKRVREQMLEKVLSFEIGWFDEDENSSAAICARLSTEANLVRSLVGDRISLLLQTFATASLAYTVGLVIAWRISSVMIATQPVAISAYYLRKVLLTNMSKKAKKAQIDGSKLAGEAVVNHKTIIAFSSQNRILSLFEEAQKGPKIENIKQAWSSGACLFICQFATATSVALGFWYGGRLIFQKHITAKQFFQVFFMLMSTGRVIADTASMTTDLAKGGEAVSSVLEILDRESKINPDYPKGIEMEETLKGYVEFKNVCFCYPTRPGQMIFNDFNLEIHAGKTVALVGQSGSGKSTVLSLIERFYDPSKGSVEIDGQDIRNYNLRFLRSQIALVSQEPALFAGTIRENIVYGNEKANETELVLAATLANAHEFVSCMDNGYDTLCGERGVQLSGGQKQRIALARAILKNPTILLLDEATSALDTVSESLVQEALEKMMADRTCIIVAHRLSTIQKSDSIALIKNGQVREQGSHSELISKGPSGSYYQLIKLQQGDSNCMQPTA